MRALRDLFAQIDGDIDGSLTAEEFSKSLEDENVQAYLAILDIEVADAEFFFKTLLLRDGTGTSLDPSEEGAVDIESFINACTKLKGDAKRADLQILNWRMQEMHNGSMLCLEALQALLDKVDVRLSRERHKKLENSVALALPRETRKCQEERRQDLVSEIFQKMDQDQDGFLGSNDWEALPDAANFFESHRLSNFDKSSRASFQNFLNMCNELTDIEVQEMHRRMTPDVEVDSKGPSKSGEAPRGIGDATSEEAWRPSTVMI